MFFVDSHVYADSEHTEGDYSQENQTAVNVTQSDANYKGFPKWRHGNNTNLLTYKYAET